MDTLLILCGAISLFYALMGLLPPAFQRAKADFKAWFLKKCQTIVTLDNQTLTSKLRPWMYGAAFLFMMLGSFVLNTWGPDDPDTRHLSFAGMGTLAIVTFGLISLANLKKIFIDLMKQGLKMAIWMAAGLILISLIFIVLYAIANDEPINSVILSQEVLQVFTQIVVGSLLAALFAGLLLSILLLFIPFTTGKAILWSVRKIANYVVIKGQKNSTEILLIILAALSFLINLYFYLVR